VVWFITGSSRGLGRAIAEAALARGDRVAATARDPRALDELVAAHGDRAVALKLDVTYPNQAAAAVHAAREAFGGIDLVVNNAGHASVKPIDGFTSLWGVVNVTRASLPVLRAQRGGHVIQISPIGGPAPCELSRFAVEGFSRVLLREVAPLGIRVTVIEPGASAEAIVSRAA